ncbi:Copia protein, partial [Mucuna pruriens]
KVNSGCLGRTVLGYDKCNERIDFLLGTPNQISRGWNLHPSNKKTNEYRLIGYNDANYAGDRIERKSTSGGCHFIRENLVSLASKKEGNIALSTTEAEYISVAHCCSQLLWIKHQLEDYDIFEKMLNKGILYKTGSKDHRSNIHLFTLFDMATAKYALSYKQQRFGRNNIAPMRLDTLKLTIPYVDIKPTKEELATTSKQSKKPTSKRLAQALKNVKASVKKRKLVLCVLDGKEEMVVEARPSPTIDEEEDDNYDAPLITRLTKRKAIDEESHGTKPINPIILIVFHKVDLNKYQESRASSSTAPHPYNNEPPLKSYLVGTCFYLHEKMLFSLLDEEEAYQLWRQHLWIHSHQNSYSHLTLQEKLDTSTMSNGSFYMMKELKTYHFDNWLSTPLKTMDNEDFKLLDSANIPIYTITIYHPSIPQHPFDLAQQVFLASKTYIDQHFNQLESKLIDMFSKILGHHPPPSSPNPFFSRKHEHAPYSRSMRNQYTSMSMLIRLFLCARACSMFYNLQFSKILFRTWNSKGNLSGNTKGFKRRVFSPSSCATSHFYSIGVVKLDG